MPSISVTFDPTGEIEYTRNAKLSWLFDGAGVMRRVTDIAKLPDENLFYIQWLLGPYAGKSHTTEEHVSIFGAVKPLCRCRISSHTGTMFFYTYEAAVAYEIECLNAMREQGVTFDAA